MSLVFGNLFAAFVFTHYNIVIFYITMMSFCCLAAVIFFNLSQPEVEEEVRNINE